MQNPVGMLPVKQAFFRDHFRFEPESEFQSEVIDFPHQSAEIADLGRIHKPVAERSRVIVALAEPAVVQHQHLDSKLRRTLCNTEEFFRIEIEIGGFPAVHEKRTLFPRPAVPDQMIPHEIMEIARHASEPLPGEGQAGFRSFKRLSGSERPGEHLRVDAEHKPGRPVLFAFRFDQEIAAVCQKRSADVSGIFRCVMRGQCDRRTVLMSGRSAHTADRLDSRMQRSPFRMTLPRPRTAQLNEIEYRMRQIKLCAHQATEHNRRGGAVDRADGADNRVAILENRIAQHEFDLAGGVAQGDFQSFDIARLPGISAGQSGGSSFPGINPVGDIKRISDLRSVLRENGCRSDPEIPGIESGELQREGVRTVLGILPRPPGGKRGMPFPDLLRDKSLLPEDFPSEMEVHRPAVGVNVKNVGNRFAGKDEKFPAFRKSDGHGGSLRC